uniref:Uncharacterized protein n=1 Tax=Arundo donax TaxID=35708 RepID=A0A0A8ZSA5_ARUDO
MHMRSKKHNIRFTLTLNYQKHPRLLCGMFKFKLCIFTRFILDKQECHDNQIGNQKVL